MMKDRVHIVGSYGMRNFGDDLFVDTILRVGHEIWPGSNVRTLVPARSKLYSAQNYLGQILRTTLTVVGTLWSTRIAFCGGSIFHDVQGNKRLRVRLSGNRKLEALGVSVGPFGSDEARSRVGKLVDRVDRIIVRDPASLSRLEKEFGIQVDNQKALGGDLVALHPNVNKSRKVNGLTITICPSAAAEQSGSDTAMEIADCIDVLGVKEWGRPNIRLLALSCNGIDDDRRLCRDIQESLKKMSIDSEVLEYSKLGIAGTCYAIAESKMVWSQRLHGLVVAYLTDVPFFAVSHHAKIRDFCTDIELDPQLVVDDGERWCDAAGRLLKDGFKSLMAPDEYRRRARGAYIGSAN